MGRTNLRYTESNAKVVFFVSVLAVIFVWGMFPALPVDVVTERAEAYGILSGQWSDKGTFVDNTAMDSEGRLVLESTNNPPHEGLYRSEVVTFTEHTRAVPTRMEYTAENIVLTGGNRRNIWVTFQGSDDVNFEEDVFNHTIQLQSGETGVDISQFVFPEDYQFWRVEVFMTTRQDDQSPRLVEVETDFTVVETETLDFLGYDVMLRYLLLFLFLLLGYVAFMKG